jgi:hypothetical protein
LTEGFVPLEIQDGMKGKGRASVLNASPAGAGFNKPGQAYVFAFRFRGEEEDEEDEMDVDGEGQEWDVVVPSFEDEEA